MRILSVSAPSGDRGPAVGYANHRAALQKYGIEITELDESIWASDDAISDFSVAWAYVRFHPAILERCMKLGVKFIVGPNTLFERGDVGPSDDWEKWLLNAGADLHVNVADYYTQHVACFMGPATRCRTLEYAYEMPTLEDHQASTTSRHNEVLLYVKDRVNDGAALHIADELQRALHASRITSSQIVYGQHQRQDFIDACLRSKLCAWISIEDYCSLAQIEAHLCGCRVIGTPWNLTIPTDSLSIVNGAQSFDIKSWVSWSSSREIVDAYVDAIVSALEGTDPAHVRQTAQFRHGYTSYVSRVRSLVGGL